MTAPAIMPISAADRPRWSVMIPAWNSQEFLAGTIESVLASDLPQGSQVEIVDDCSTDGTAAIAARYAGAGVSYFVHDSQQGAPANFNASIRLARGELVHLLHADDAVVRGFYTAADHALSQPAVNAFVCRTQYITDRGEPMTATRSESRTGTWADASSVLAVSNRVRPPGIAVRRSAYEDVHGFREDLPHAADWEMWSRLAKHGPIWFEDRILARYRVHQGQDTAAKVRDGSNISERLAVLEIINEASSAGRSNLRKGLLYTAAFASRTALDLARKGDWEAARAQLVAGFRCGLAGLVGLPGVAPWPANSP